MASQPTRSAVPRSRATVPAQPKRNPENLPNFKTCHVKRFQVAKGPAPYNWLISSDDDDDASDAIPRKASSFLSGRMKSTSSSQPALRARPSTISTMAKLASKSNIKESATTIAISDRCPVFGGVLYTSKLPSFKQLKAGDPGVPVYFVCSSGTEGQPPEKLRVPIQRELRELVDDENLLPLMTVGSHEALRLMVAAIYKFLLWQCGALEFVHMASKSEYALDWDNLPQLIWDRGFRVANLPAVALYPNSQAETMPSNYPIDVLEAIVLQFAHTDPKRRFGVVRRSHDTKPMPFMSKVMRGVGSDTTPIEWSCAGSSKDPVIIEEEEDGSCHCTLCLGPSVHPGSQLVVAAQSDERTVPQVAQEWRRRYDETGEVFAIPDDIIDEYDDPSYAKGDEPDSESQLSSSDAEDDAGDLTVAGGDAPTILAAETQWELEDLEVERQRAAEDAALKRKREEEDHSRTLERGQKRIKLGYEYLSNEAAKKREADDRLREEARRAEDEALRQRLEQQLEALL